MKRFIRKNRIRIFAAAEIIMLTLIYYFLWRRGYTHGISGYPEYYGYGRFVLMGIYAFLTGFFLYNAGGFRFGRSGNLSLVLTQWAMMLVVNIITYFQLSLTAKELVAKRPMFDVTLTEFAVAAVFIAIIRELNKRFHLGARMLFIGEGVEEGQTVDGYRVRTVIKEYGTGGNAERPDAYDAVLIHGLEELQMYEVMQACMKLHVPVYVAQDKALIHGVSRGSSENGLNYVLVKSVGDKWIDGVIEVVRGYLMVG